MKDSGDTRVSATLARMGTPLDEKALLAWRTEAKAQFDSLEKTAAGQLFDALLDVCRRWHNGAEGLPPNLRDAYRKQMLEFQVGIRDHLLLVLEQTAAENVTKDKRAVKCEIRFGGWVRREDLGIFHDNPRFEIWTEQSDEPAMLDVVLTHPLLQQLEKLVGADAIVNQEWLRHAVARVAASVRSDTFPRRASLSERVPHIELTWDDVERMKGSLGKKTCGKRMRHKEEDYCSVAANEDTVAVAHLGRRGVMPVSPDDCASCEYPDDDFRCSSFLHPRVGVRGAASVFDVSEFAVLSAKCADGKAEIHDRPQYCRAGEGRACWKYSVTAEPSAEEPAAAQPNENASGVVLKMQLLRSVWVVEGDERQGTAFRLHGVGFTTCAHVVDKNMVAYRVLEPGRKFKVSVRSIHVDEDVAFLTFEDCDVVDELVASNVTRLEDHQRILVAGFPKYSPGASIAMPRGEVVGSAHIFRHERILTDAAIVEGASGCPVLDEKGEVVGVAVTGGADFGERGETRHSIVPIATVLGLASKE